jgi:murein DD-endopeptidase MepM/ murein hydrolase activator NlpD
MKNRQSLNQSLVLRLLLGGLLLSAPLAVERLCHAAETPFADTPAVVSPAVSNSSTDQPTQVAAPISSTPANGAGAKKSYRVVSGDTLYEIAQRFLGDGKRYWEIVNLNKNKYPGVGKNPDLIFPGQEFELPDDATGAETTPQPTSQTSGGEKEGTVEVSTSLNVRSGPWAGIIGKLNSGDKVRILSREGDWYKISWNGQTAFVHANYIATPDNPAGRVAVQNPASSRPPENDPAVTVGEGRWGANPCSPMPSRASSEYGWRTIFGSRSFHNGIDLPVPNGTRLNALGDGVVTACDFEPGGGRYVKVRYDNGMESFYCHLQSFSVRPGQRVSMGQEIARSDNTGQYTTGAHLHMEIRKNGAAVNPRSIPGMSLP